MNSGEVKNPFSYPLPGSHHHGSEHGDEDHEEEHDEEHEEAGEDAEKTESEEQPEGEEHEQKEDAGEEKHEDSETEDKSEGATKDDSNTEDNNNKPGAKEGKGMSEVPDDNTLSKKTKDGETASFDETHELESDSDSRVLHMPDAKGGAKRRIESPYGNKQGEEDKTHDSGLEDKVSWATHFHDYMIPSSKNTTNIPT